jgi:NAD(P)-dependent dehydrogenase (short-subunit alcohol dehydrogenase family)
MSLIDFRGRTYLVTGAASGIGLRTAERLVDGGARVVGFDRHPVPLSACRHVQVDMADPASIDHALAQVADERFDGLCNIAGVPGTVPDLMLARINYLGLRYLTTKLLPALPRGGAIVNLASMAGSMWRDRAALLWELATIEDWDACEQWIAGHPVMFDQAYRKFKEALIVWVLGHASEWMQRYGVRANCVSPAPVLTPIFEDFKRSLGQQNVADIIARTGRAATPDDIAPVVLFLLSDAARWIVGVDLPAEGGLTASRFRSSMDAMPAPPQPGSE